ncbi:hypothetical protein ACOTY6_17970, partial [Enterobacter cloacae complex sp. SHL014]
LMATATVTLLLGSVPLYAQTADVQQKLAELEYVFETRYYFPQEREALFSVTDSALHDLQQFIRTLPKARSLASATDAQGN